MMEEQKMGITYVIFQNTRKKKTWPTMEMHFCKALENICATKDMILEESSFNQLNMVNEVIDGVKQIVSK